MENKMTEFKTLLTKTQEELKLFLMGELFSKGYTDIVDTEDGTAFFSDLPNQPLLVAHLDTINTKYSSYGHNYYKGNTLNNVIEEEATPTEDDILITDDFIMLSPLCNSNIECLGADDRVGVKTILDLIDMGLKPHILFTTDEESGCLGSRSIIKNEAYNRLSECSMMIQIDRGVHEGKWNEMVFYSYDHTSNPDIFTELSKGFALAQGSYTDVAVLGPHYNKPIVNISASYKNEHTTREFIYLKAYKENLQSLYDFIQWSVKQDTTEWEYKEKPKPKPITTTYYSGTTTSYSPYLPAKRTKEQAEGKTVYDLLDEICSSYFKKQNDFEQLYDDYVEFMEDVDKEYTELMVKALYIKGLVVCGIGAFEQMLDGTYYAKLFPEITDEERALQHKYLDYQGEDEE